MLREILESITESNGEFIIGKICDEIKDMKDDFDDLDVEVVCDKKEILFKHKGKEIGKAYIDGNYVYIGVEDDDYDFEPISKSDLDSIPNVLSFLLEAFEEII